MKNFENRACRRSFITFWLFFALFLAFFWVCCGPTDGMAFGLLAMWFGLPTVAFGVSVVWGIKGDRWAYVLPFVFAVSEPLLDFFTFRLIAFFYGNGLHAPDWALVPFVLADAFAGLALGRLLRTRSRRKSA